MRWHINFGGDDCPSPLRLMPLRGGAAEVTERILQPLKTRRVVIATTDNTLRSLLLRTLVVGAAVAAWTFYRLRAD